MAQLQPPPALAQQQAVPTAGAPASARAASPPAVKQPQLPQQPQPQQQAAPHSPTALQLLQLLHPSPFDSTATAAQKAAAQRFLTQGPRASAAALLLPSMSLPTPGSGGGSLANGGIAAGSSSSWWALDSPAALASAPHTSPAEQLQEQSKALRRVVGTLQKELLKIEAQQALLAAAAAQRTLEEDEARRAAAQLQQAELQQQLQLLLRMQQQPGLAEPEARALVRLISGLRQEIRAAAEAAQAPPPSPPTQGQQVPQARIPHSHAPAQLQRAGSRPASAGTDSAFGHHGSSSAPAGAGTRPPSPTAKLLAAVGTSSLEAPAQSHDHMWQVSARAWPGTCTAFMAACAC